MFEEEVIHAVSNAFRSVTGAAPDLGGGGPRSTAGDLTLLDDPIPYAIGHRGEPFPGLEQPAVQLTPRHYLAQVLVRQQACMARR